MQWLQQLACVSQSIVSPSVLSKSIGINRHKAWPNLMACAVCRYGRVDFTWSSTGSIQVVTHVQALPFVSLHSQDFSSNHKVLVALVLLVLLTAVQAAVLGYSVWLSITEATSWWKMLQV